MKESVGRGLDNPRLAREGSVEKNAGKMRQDAARPMEKMKGAAQEAKGKLNEELGDGMEDQRMEAEGASQKMAGRAKRKANE
jgi:uncharacterized protein YjbJ (UPF0337 family)